MSIVTNIWGEYLYRKFPEYCSKKDFDTISCRISKAIIFNRNEDFKRLKESYSPEKFTSEEGNRNFIMSDNLDDCSRKKKSVKVYHDSQSTSH